MSSDLVISPLSLAAIGLATLGAILLLAGIVAVLRGLPRRCGLRTVSGRLLLAPAGVAGSIAVGVAGYRVLTREDIAARLFVRPAGPQRFAATVRFPDGRERTFDVAGDEIYVDAHILKWKPFANMLGLHTAYELDRVAGRYRAIEQERSAVRTVHSLGRERPVDLFGLRQRYKFLAPLLDAEYGSATFVPVTRPAELELRVSTSGLLIPSAHPTPNRGATETTHQA